MAALHSRCRSSPGQAGRPSVQPSVVPAVPQRCRQNLAVRPVSKQVSDRLISKTAPSSPHGPHTCRLATKKNPKQPHAVPLDNPSKDCCVHSGFQESLDYPTQSLQILTRRELGRPSENLQAAYRILNSGSERPSHVGPSNYVSIPISC